MTKTFSTSLIAAGFLAATSGIAFAEGCGWGHSAEMTAQAPITVEETVTAMTGESQVLTTGQISMAGVDCTATPEAPQCVALSPSAN